METIYFYGGHSFMYKIMLIDDDKETALQEFHTSELKVLKRPSRDAKEDKIDESLKHLE